MVTEDKKHKKSTYRDCFSIHSGSGLSWEKGEEA